MKIETIIDDKLTALLLNDLELNCSIPNLKIAVFRAMTQVTKSVIEALRNNTYGVQSPHKKGEGPGGALAQSISENIEVKDFAGGVMGSVGPSGNARIYGSAQETGANIKHPGGTAYITIDTGMSVFIKNSRVAEMEKLLHRPLKRTGPHKITIPPHWYLRNTLIKMKDEIKDIISEQVVKLEGRT